MTQVHPYWLLAATFLMALVPVALGACTSYLKISIVLGMLRNALGTQQAPGGLIVMTLSLALSLSIMAPVLEESLAAADALRASDLAQPPRQEALKAAAALGAPWRRFMLLHAGSRELQMLASLNALPGAGDDPPLSVLLPAFAISELKEAFAMGFVLLLPFLVIDLVVANVLAGLGMYMMSPVMISLPLKLLLFVVADGWLLLCRALLLSYRT